MDLEEKLDCLLMQKIRGMSREEVEAELRKEGIDPEKAYLMLEKLLKKYGIKLRQGKPMSDLPTFPKLAAECTFEESIVYEGLKITQDNSSPGREQSNLVTTVSAPRRQFNLKFGVLSSADMNTLWSFYIQQSGQLKPFLFTSPRNGQQYTVRFTNKAMSRTLFVYLLESTGLNLIEVVGEENP